MRSRTTSYHLVDCGRTVEGEYQMKTVKAALIHNYGGPAVARIENTSTAVSHRGGRGKLWILQSPA